MQGFRVSLKVWNNDMEEHTPVSERGLCLGVKVCDS